MDDERLQRRKRGEIIMGTPCAIGMKMADGSVRAIRCNYDGYVAGAGVILGGWYTDAAKVEAMLALGELSQLAAEPAEEPADCIAYHRDRHEPMRPAKRFTSIKEYQRNAKGEMSADYLYLYDSGRWSVYGLYHDFHINKQQKSDYKICIKKQKQTSKTRNRFPVGSRRRYIIIKNKKK